MRLDRYIDTHGFTRQQFADAIGCEQPTVSRFITGARMPNPDLMRKIADVTNGEVTPNDFFEIKSVSPALCTICDHRLDDATIRACAVTDCPNAQKDAA